MTFNPKTYNYAIRVDLNILWNALHKALRLDQDDSYLPNPDRQGQAYIPVGPTKSEALALCHDLNRYRSARRAQRKMSGDLGGNDWDYVKLTVVELDDNKGWAVKAKDGTEKFMHLKVLDSKGNTL